MKGIKIISAYSLENYTKRISFYCGRFIIVVVDRKDFMLYE
jgi:hypothetical protein